MKNNMSRRQFLKTGGLLGCNDLSARFRIIFIRDFQPEICFVASFCKQRNFISKAVDAAIEEAKPK